MFKIGDYVTRRKYNHDIIFKIIDIKDKTIILKGADVRLLANALVDDLEECKYCKKKEIIRLNKHLDRSKYFYIPGIILHIDTDSEYKEQCEEFYKDDNIKYYAYCFNIEDFKKNIIRLIETHMPSIIVITGHDAYYKNNNKYLNSQYYIDTVKEIRKKYSYEDVVVVAGACQSDYENLLKSGSTYASSPTHSNIHALDPAIIAASISLTESKKKIDIEEILSKTKYGSKGFGGIMTKGKMKTGYPRKEKNEY